MLDFIKTGEHYGLPGEPFNFESVETWINALEEARVLESREIGSGHLLVAFLSSKATVVEIVQSFLGIISKEELERRNGLAFLALKNCGANHSDARRHLKSVIGYGDKPHKITKLVARIQLNERPNSSEVSLVARRAVDWRRKLDSKQIGDEHLLLALLDERDEVVTKLLEMLQISPERLSQTVLKLANHRKLDD